MKHRLLALIMPNGINGKIHNYLHKPKFGAGARVTPQPWMKFKKNLIRNQFSDVVNVIQSLWRQGNRPTLIWI